ncbi:MAG: endonuclease NucS domain-containing protein, partial [Candidatus Sulfotelmatobacter sp.]
MVTKLYQINGRELVPIGRTRLETEDQLQEWIARDPRLIGMDVLVLGREVFTDFDGRIDILGLDRDGNLVIIECKRDLTPRDVVAQILDYASWVASLNTRDVHNIAQQKIGKPLGNAFQERFDTTLPETLNSSHSLVIVASEFDPSSKRIVEYLSESHGVAINTV